ncbi:MAG TPA: hypothetical protein VFZ57_07955, partial [Thermoanaerobaculia bacterium]|nr:hypothetical protein [Thermoanaerobaculia bacterium]
MKILRMVPSASAMLGFFVGLLLAAPPLRGAEPKPAAAASPSSLSKKNPSSSFSSLAEAAVQDGKVAGVSFTV